MSSQLAEHPSPTRIDCARWPGPWQPPVGLRISDRPLPYSFLRRPD
jgi:hypothetical protein